MSLQTHTNSTYQQNPDVTVAEVKHPLQFSYGAGRWMLNCLALFPHIVLPTLVSKKNPSKVGRRKNLLNHKGGSDYYYLTAAWPEPWRWPCSVWAFPRREKTAHAASIHRSKTLACPLWFSPPALVSQRTLPSLLSTVCSVNYRIVLQINWGKRKMWKTVIFSNI